MKALFKKDRTETMLLVVYAIVIFSVLVSLF